MIEETHTEQPVIGKRYITFIRQTRVGFIFSFDLSDELETVILCANLLYGLFRPVDERMIILCQKPFYF